MWPDWRDETVVCVACGPSASRAPLEIGQGLARFIAIKESVKLCPWADALYACDFHWWTHHRGMSAYKGLRLAGDKRAAAQYPPMLSVTVSANNSLMRFDEIGVVGWGGNSGFHAVNLAAQWGAKRILLVGFDMTIEKGRHWFGDRGNGYLNDRTPTRAMIKTWIKALDKAAPSLAQRGIDVLNCSIDSALSGFRKVEFEEAIRA